MSPESTRWPAIAAEGTDARQLASAVERWTERSDAPTTAAEVADVWQRLAVRAAVAGDPSLRRLEHLGDGRPPVLAWRGPDRLPDQVTVAIVGARRATSYGAGIASWLAQEAARVGVLVVSGGAVGIDAAAHRGALEADGRTAVVLGCGHDVAYPRPHAVAGGLFDQVLQGGGWILSESLPGATAKAWRVRARNRIVAALADLVVVVEGGSRSGALVTAGFAADLGVPVAAVPGDVRAPMSVAPHRLLREGAAPVTCPADLLELLPGATVVGPDATGTVGPDATVTVGSDGPATVSALPDPLLQALRDVWPRASSVDDLVAASGLGVGSVLAALTRARVAGELAESPEGVRLTRGP